MPAILIPNPKFSYQTVTSVPPVGWKIYTYEIGAGFINKLTHTTSDQAAENTNPVVLDARGEADIWWEGAYKIVIKDADDNTIDTIDNYTGSQDLSQWDASITATFATTTAFTITGNVVSDFEVDRKIRLNDASTLYGVITVSNYSSPNTTVTVELDSGVLSSSLDTAQLSILEATNSAVPKSLNATKFTSTVYFKKGADIASANDLVLLEDGNDNDITGSVDVNGMTDGIVNERRHFHSDGIFDLKHNTAASAGFSSLWIVQGAADITTAAGDEWDAIYDGTVWRIVNYNKAANAPLSLLDNSNHMSGLIISSDVDTDHDINITVGYANDSTNVYSMNLASEITKQIDVSWAAGDDAGGLSSSLTVANNTWYHVFLVTIAGATDVIFDTSLTCANGVADHTVTAYKWISSALTDGSANILPFLHSANRPNYFEWVTPANDITATAPGTAAVNRTLSTPLGLRLTAHLAVILNNTTVSTPSHCLISDISTTDTAPSLSDFHVGPAGNGTGMVFRIAQVMDVLTSASSQVRSRVDHSNATVTIRIRTIGWSIDRGAV